MEENKIVEETVVAEGIGETGGKCRNKALILVLVVAVVAFFFAFVAVRIAVPKEVRVAYVDSAYVIDSSNPGKEINGRLQALRERLDKDLRDYAASVQGQPNAPQLIAQRQAALSAAFNAEYQKARELMFREFRRCVEELRAARKLDAVVLANTVVAADESANLSEAVIDKMNQLTLAEEGKVEQQPASGEKK